MQYIRFFFVFALLTVFAAVAAFAQEIVIPEGVDQTQYMIMSAIVLLVPVIIGQLKKTIYNEVTLADGSKTYVPPGNWAPWILTLAGPLLAYILGLTADWITGAAGSAWLYFGLGVLAQFVRKLGQPLMDAATNKASKQQVLDAKTYSTK